MPYDFNYPEERTNPEYKFDEIISSYNANFSLISTGSTEFTGNTSATCISDLYVSDIHGCSALTIHGQIAQVNNVVAGENSIAFGENNSSGYYQEGTSIDIISACTIYTGYGLDNYYLTLSGDQTTEWNSYISITSPIGITIYGGTGATQYYEFSNVWYDGGSNSTFLYTSPLPANDDTFTSFSASIETQATIDNRNTYAGGSGSIAYGDNSFVHSVNSTATGDRSVVLGGQNIIGANDDTVYVPNFNIGSLNQNNSATNILTRETDGSISYRDSSTLGGSISYSNTIFVDQINGNDGTAVTGRFDKPCQSIYQASYMASLISKTSSSKVLIHVRGGQYYWNGGLQNYLDYYCEPGVVFTGGRVSDQSYGAVNSNFYGYAVFLNTDVYISQASTVNFEFDYMSNSQAAFLIIPASGTATVTVKANYIYSSTYGTGYGVTIRNNSNVTFNVSRGIEAVHSTIAFRAFTGKAIINSNIYLGTGNVYGGNFKQALIVYDGSSTGNIIINGNIENKDTVDYGGISSMVSTWAGSSPNMKINGDIIGGPIKALDAGQGGKIEIRGKLTSNSTNTIWCYGSTQFVFRDCRILNSGIATLSYPVAVNSTAKTFFKDCYFYNPQVDSGLIVINGLSCDTILDGCQGYSVGASGYSVNTTVGGGKLYVNNSRFNKGLSPSVVDIYSPSGFILDTNTIVPNF